MLRAEGLRHAFGRIRALDDISFALVAGETLTILGPNGAGKTTLLRVLAGLIHPQGGRVALEGGRRAVGWIGHAAHLDRIAQQFDRLPLMHRLHHHVALEDRRVLKHLADCIDRRHGYARD